MTPGRHCDRPKVSVLVLTYNHQNFLSQALADILSQKTTFPYEVVIGEDCSTDATRAVVAEYAGRHPECIRPLIRDRNIGATENFVHTLAHCRGDYVAMLEGDDRWLSQDKLQRQSEFMDAHPDCAFCFHDAARIDETGREIAAHYAEAPMPAQPDMDWLLAMNLVPTCSVMFRRSLLPALPEESRRLRMQDWPCWLHLATCGTVHNLGHVWSAYRLHTQGMWSTREPAEQLKGILEFYEFAVEFLKKQADTRAGAWLRAARRHRKQALWLLIRTLATTGRWQAARAFVWQYLRMRHVPWLPPRSERMLLLRILLGLPSAPMRSGGDVRGLR